MISDEQRRKVAQALRTLPSDMPERVREWSDRIRKPAAKSALVALAVCAVVVGLCVAGIRLGVSLAVGA